MTAGMAANRPIAVAKSASAMPGATTASDVFFDAAIERNDVMMPQTVPNRPMKGADEPMVASTRSLDSSRSTSRWMVTSTTLSMRWLSPITERLVPSKERFHSRIAATKTAAMVLVGRSASIR